MSRQPVYPPQGACPPGAQQCPYPSTPQSGYSTYPSTPQYGYARAQASGYPGAGSAPFCGTNAQQGFMPKPSKGGVPKEQCSGRLDLGESTLLSEEEDRQALDDLAIENFQEYLRIRSVQPKAKYDKCIEFLQEQAESLMLPCHVYELSEGKPIVVMTWMGKEPSLPSILLSSHMDVAPVYEKSWIHKPFAARKCKGKIYGRGAQDMKSVSVQYMEAIRRLKMRGKSFERTIHIVFTPDEEAGGDEGMMKFVESETFKSLEVGFGMDEGSASTSDEFLVHYAEKVNWQFIFHCPGDAEDAPGEKAAYIMNKLSDQKKEEQRLTKDDPARAQGVTSMTVCRLSGGKLVSIVPPEFTISVNAELSIKESQDRLERKLNRWCEEAGSGVTMEFLKREPAVEATKLDDDNPYWKGFKKAMDEMKLKVVPMIRLGATDARFLRTKGIPAIGFSPINKAEPLAHANEEFIEVETFLKGIEIYCKIISNLADLPDSRATEDENATKK